MLVRITQSSEASGAAADASTADSEATAAAAGQEEQQPADETDKKTKQGGKKKKRSHWYDAVLEKKRLAQEERTKACNCNCNTSICNVLSDLTVSVSVPTLNTSKHMPMFERTGRWPAMLAVGVN